MRKPLQNRPKSLRGHWVNSNHCPSHHIDRQFISAMSDTGRQSLTDNIIKGAVKVCFILSVSILWHSILTAWLSPTEALRKVWPNKRQTRSIRWLAVLCLTLVFFSLIHHSQLPTNFFLQSMKSSSQMTGKMLVLVVSYCTIFFPFVKSGLDT